MKFKHFELEELEKLHLSVLREIGRRMGVRAPTAAKKEELTENIIKIQDGLLNPVPQSKRGAKPKIVIDLSAFEVEDDENEENEKSKESEEDEKPLDFSPVDYKLVLNDVSVDEKKNGEYETEGVLDVHSSGYGFLRSKAKDGSASDVYVSASNIKKYGLRKGDEVRAVAKRVSDACPALQKVLKINGMDAAFSEGKSRFDELVPSYPDCRIKLEREGENDISLRCIDLFSPIGFGQRGLIVAPPKTGKTTLLKKIAQSVVANYPEATVIVLLIDERPEEVTDFKRNVKCEVVYSTFDNSADHHVRVTENVLTRAKRLVESGKDVIVLMDSITKLTRAYNNTVETSGRTLTGGLDTAAFSAPKKFFGAARNIENGGSLTIISTALVDTGSRMDDVIFEEFKGTGNMEIHLSRALAERRIFPAIDLYKSGTRKEELLLSNEEYNVVVKIRRTLAERSDASESLIDMMKKTQTNAEFVEKAESWLKLYRK